MNRVFGSHITVTLVSYHGNIDSSYEPLSQYQHIITPLKVCYVRSCWCIDGEMKSIKSISCIEMIALFYIAW